MHDDEVDDVTGRMMSRESEVSTLDFEIDAEVTVELTADCLQDSVGICELEPLLMQGTASQIYLK